MATTALDLYRETRDGLLRMTRPVLLSGEGPLNVSPVRRVTARRAARTRGAEGQRAAPFAGVHGGQPPVELLLGMPIRNQAPELARHGLMRYCPLNQPCHADVLLEIANS